MLLFQGRNHLLFEGPTYIPTLVLDLEQHLGLDQQELLRELVLQPMMAGLSKVLPSLLQLSLLLRARMLGKNLERAMPLLSLHRQRDQLSLSILARDLYLQLLGLALSPELGLVTKQLDQRILGQQPVQRMQLLGQLQWVFQLNYSCANYLSHPSPKRQLLLGKLGH